MVPKAGKAYAKDPLVGSHFVFPLPLLVEATPNK